MIDGLGGATAELIRMGVLTLYRDWAVSQEEQKLKWVDLWGLHSLVRAFVDAKTGDEDRRTGHLGAGLAYQEWVKKPEARWSEQVEGIHHRENIEKRRYFSGIRWR